MGSERILQKAEIWLGAFCLGLMFGVICLNVVMRYAFSQPLYWAEELSDYLFVWIGFLSCAYAVADDSHIRMTLVVRLLGPRTRRLIGLAMDLVLLAMFVSFAGPAWHALDSLHISTGLQIPERYPYAIVPLTMALCALHIGCKILRDVRAVGAAKTEIA